MPDIFADLAYLHQAKAERHEPTTPVAKFIAPFRVLNRIQWSAPWAHEPACARPHHTA